MAVKDTESFVKKDWLLCMERVKEKDKASYALVFKHFAPRLKQFTYKHMGNEQVAVELVQETMTTVWQKSHLFDGSKSSLSTWIYTIARNLCFDTLRKQRGRDLHIHSEDIWPNDYCPPDMVEHYTPEHEMLKEQVVKFLDILPEAQKKVVQAVYLEELPHQQVADMYDIPVGTVKSRLRLAVEKLRYSIEVERL
ncbi:RNA polymerase sigma factor [Vibrio sp. Isolate25]|uniref:RNA polymerase sigma factor n=1 Tax=Vibrio TaxID=662 RepID=UPI001EFE0EE3|nr:MULTISPECIES: RNA polymerase sigma factor [Vibrio]MCG9596581.1 RNA polymerase sigma factor [Vibrio sp. Isolate25]MCG9683634.1 RNA polymerase sigma factor [Vibrio sp. Isolate23]USD31958.1 RNA polymerase sigma factor [Vibrio sp. SCSIO 43186]USD45002.1 RNA polymerase sigma factor [Vibrio sp. SCSIO 43145]USD69081.1 RNA polymerase sigma factor [Vibrio sp. SCSIO 43139]